MGKFLKAQNQIVKFGCIKARKSYVNAYNRKKFKI